MTDSRIAPALLAAYRQAEYVIQFPGVPFVLHVDVYSPPLDTLHSQYGVASSAVITACNPHSVPVSTEENDLALQKLEQYLKTMGHILIDSTGHDPQHRWPDEPGFLALGIDRNHAKLLGIRYKQNAIVFCGSNAIPELVTLG